MASGWWAIYRPGRLRVEITSGDLFRRETLYVCHERVSVKNGYIRFTATLSSQKLKRPSAWLPPQKAEAPRNYLELLAHGFILSPLRRFRAQ